MPHNLANIQPPLTGSSLSLEEPGGKENPQSSHCSAGWNWLLHQPRAQHGHASGWWPISSPPCCSEARGKGSPSLLGVLCTPQGL